MKTTKLLFLNIAFIVASNSYSGDIAYGEVSGIKVYDFSNSKVTKIYFKGSASNADETDCNKTAVITHSQHEPSTVQQMVSVALAGHMSGKSVRAYSENTGSCEAALLSVQDSYY